MTEIKTEKKEIKKISVFLTLGITIVALGVGFGLGTLFQKNQKPNFKNANSQFQMGDRSSGARGNGNRQNVQNGGQMGQSQNHASGEVTKIDDSSITIKTQNGGSKLILISDSTAYKQLTDGDKSKLKLGSQITVEGESSTDGSLTGKTISIN